MPVSIYRVTARHEENTKLAWLGDGEWTLAPQIELLEKWIDANAEQLPAGEYVADVGFCWRRSASGGGAALDPGFLKKMGEAGFSLFLSEYPGFDDEDDFEDGE